MLPRVIVHNMVSVDGRMDWINGDIGLYYQLAVGLQYDAILSSSNTLIKGTEDLSEKAWHEMEEAGPLNSEFEKQHLSVPHIEPMSQPRQIHGRRREEPATGGLPHDGASRDIRIQQPTRGRP